jgi:O-antigen/teichoic acid export membrane protein
MRRSLTRDLLIYGIGEVLVKAFGLITLPLYTHLFDPAEFGVVGIVLTISSLFMAVISLGSDVSYARFFFAVQTHAQRAVVTTTWISFLAAFGLIAALILIPAGDLLATVTTGRVGDGSLIRLAILLAPLRLTNLMLAQVLRNQYRARTYTALNILTLAVTVALILVAILGLHLGIAGVLVGMVAGELLVLPIRFAFVREMFVAQVHGATLTQMIRYGIPIVPASLAYWVFSASDRLLLSNLAGLEEVGLYSAAVSIVSMTTVAVTALSQAWMPHAVEAFERDRSEASALYARMLTFILVSFGGLAVFLTTFAPEIVDVLTGDSYRTAELAVGPLALGVVAQATTQVTSGGITLMHRTSRMATFSWIAAVLNVAMNLALIPLLGMVGAAWATALTYVALSTSYGMVSQRLWAIAYEWRRGAMAIAVTLAAVAGAYGLNAALEETSSDVLLSIAVKLAYLIVFVLALVIAGAITKADVLRLARSVRA